jgi:hypothetical protein
MKKITFFTTIFILFLFNTGCQSIEESEKIADQFYSYLKVKNYDKIIDLLDKEALEATPKDNWIEALKGREKYWGGTKSYNRTSFDISTHNGSTTVTLKYKVECEKATIYEVLRFYKRNDGFKIVWYEFNKDEKELEKIK